jgi:hypothetical protein
MKSFRNLIPLLALLLPGLALAASVQACVQGLDESEGQQQHQTGYGYGYDHF